MGGFFQGGQHEPCGDFICDKDAGADFPEGVYEEQYEAAVKMISTHMPPKNVKIRHIAG